MKKSRVIVIHLKSGRSCKGRYIRKRHGFYELNKHSIELDGNYVESVNELLLVPVRDVQLIEVV